MSKREMIESAAYVFIPHEDSGYVCYKSRYEFNAHRGAVYSGEYVASLADTGQTVLIVREA
ncbi:hypothetical protein MHB77_32380 [Paenibacillus sp. FSL K6-3166]|uniref:hypothetical protein n=1 Tax=unclassified Paenibacillus TaxID=185978 RepID=UPI000BA023B3|nr:hypothetical protein [Paenibacillus sp. VTT E-133291]OZQ84698.1 hypothetical protein CA598_23175 [Paenibacillus sp. VTT E-133291]